MQSANFCSSLLCILLAKKWLLISIWCVDGLSFAVDLNCKRWTCFFLSLVCIVCARARQSDFSEAKNKWLSDVSHRKQSSEGNKRIVQVDLSKSNAATFILCTVLCTHFVAPLEIGVFHEGPVTNFTLEKVVHVLIDNRLEHGVQLCKIFSC